MNSRAERRAGRAPGVAEAYAPGDVDVVLDLLETMELAWHDVYGDLSPPDSVIDDVLLLGDGDLAALIQAVRLALADSRDLRVAADRIRTSGE